MTKYLFNRVNVETRYHRVNIETGYFYQGFVNAVMGIPGKTYVHFRGKACRSSDMVTEASPQKKGSGDHSCRMYARLALLHVFFSVQQIEQVHRAYVMCLLQVVLL